MTNHMTPRTVDHLVLPVSNIDNARDRYVQLGFTVAPDGKHPFGTENCCVFFKDGTFLEPIGIAHRETCEAKAIKGHTFVANDQKYRFRRGVEGFSHLVLKSNDAKVDHKLFKSQGMSAGRMVRFSRGFETPAGEKGRVSFHLAFASDARSPDADFFTCQVVDAPDVDRTALKTHANGVIGLKEVVLSELNPTDFQYFFQTYLNQREMDADSFGMSFKTANADVSVMSPDGLQAFYGISSPRSERGMLFEAFVLSVRNLAETKQYLESSGVLSVEQGNRLLVAPAQGQGTYILFEEAA